MDLFKEASEGKLRMFVSNGHKYFAGHQRYVEYGVNWNIYVVLADRDYLGGMQDAINQTALIVVLSIVFCILFVYQITQWVAKPIIELNDAAKELTHGNLKIVQDDNRQDELGELTRSFNNMSMQLSQLVAHLEEEVDARTHELQERNEELQRLSFLDGLTGIANRRCFDSTLENAWNISLRHHRPISLIMLDIDFFKNFNDTYGHLAGDDCLKAIAKLLKANTRRISDLSARYGGEEFAIILQEMDVNKVINLAESIRMKIENLKIEHMTSPFQKVTVSMGIAFITPTKESTIKAFIDLADHALYTAKESGRNQVILNENQ